ncbi:MAG: hydroxysqualene dehydroxylase HpnE [Pseudomonadota bacterium]
MSSALASVHVVGAGLAGLAAALALVRSGRRVMLYEAAPQAGGRCRSFFDERLGRTLDNGGHVILSANRAAFDYLDAIGGRQGMIEIAPPAFPFLDLETGGTWTLRPNAGPIPWWVFAPSRRIPGTRARDYLGAWRLLAAGADDTVAGRLSPHTLAFKRLWAPLATAVMNADPREAAARPLGRMLLETFARGGAGCRPWLARDGLSAAFVDPALAVLQRAGAGFRPGWRLTRLDFATERVSGLRFDDRAVAVGPGEAVVLALPPRATGDLVPQLGIGEGPLAASRAIVNAHFRLDAPAVLPSGQPLLGLVGGLAQWLIARADVVSVTVSAAGALADLPEDEILPRLWRDVARALGRPAATPAVARLIKEKRATFAQLPQAFRARPGPRTKWENLMLAGDWTDTGLPATIEGAIRSGFAAGRAVLDGNL